MMKTMIRLKLKELWAQVTSENLNSNKSYKVKLYLKQLLLETKTKLRWGTVPLISIKTMEKEQKAINRILLRKAICFTRLKKVMKD